VQLPANGEQARVPAPPGYIARDVCATAASAVILSSRRRRRELDFLLRRQFHALAHALLHGGEVADVRFQSVDVASELLGVREEVGEDLLAQFEGEF